MGSRRKRRKQTGGLFPVGALATSILGTLGGAVIKKLFGGKRRRRQRQYVQRQSIVRTKSYTTTRNIT